MLAQLLNNLNNDETISSNHDEEENPHTELPKTEKVKGKFHNWYWCYKRHPSSDCISGSEEWTEESRDDASLPTGRGLSFLSAKVKLPTLHTYDGNSSPNQHIYYFHLQTNNMIDNDDVMARLFIDTLKWVAFDWFKSLSNGFINSWIDLKTRFLSWFYEDDTEVTMDKLLSMI